MHKFFFLKEVLELKMLFKYFVHVGVTYIGNGEHSPVLL